MNSEEFLRYRSELDGLCTEILGVKGEAYAHEGTSGDRLGNFWRAARKFDVSPLVVIGIFLSKHLDSIVSWIRESNVDRELPPDSYVGGEHIEQRIADARNYLDLLYAMYCEILDFGEPPASRSGRTNASPGRQEH